MNIVARVSAGIRDAVIVRHPLSLFCRARFFRRLEDADNCGALERMVTMPCHKFVATCGQQAIPDVHGAELKLGQIDRNQIDPGWVWLRIEFFRWRFQEDVTLVDSSDTLSQISVEF